jgi:hypothetical protein
MAAQKAKNAETLSASPVAIRADEHGSGGDDADGLSKRVS